MDLLTRMIKIDPEERINSSDFFKHPVIQHESEVFTRMLQELAKNPDEYIS